MTLDTGVCVSCWQVPCTGVHQPAACAHKHPRFALMGCLQTRSEGAGIARERKTNLMVCRQMESAQQKKK